MIPQYYFDKVKKPLQRRNKSMGLVEEQFASVRHVFTISDA